MFPSFSIVLEDYTVSTIDLCCCWKLPHNWQISCLVDIADCIHVYHIVQTGRSGFFQAFNGKARSEQPEHMLYIYNLINSQALATKNTQ